MIECRNLTKSFGDTQAVKGVNAVIRDNAVFGLVGTNGAGKSTVLRMIAGVLKPDDGLALVDGMPSYDNVHAKEAVFYL